MSRRVLITGAFGYLGGRISQRLQTRADIELRLASRHVPAAPSWARGLDIAAIDFRENDVLSRVCRDVDTILHLSTANQTAASKDPAQAVTDTGLGTLALLRAAQREGVKRFIHMSTVHVYGMALAGRVSEEMAPRPQSPYAIAHRIAEDFVLAAHVQQAIDGCVLRLSNGIGAPADPSADCWSLVANDLCRQAVRDGALRLKSSGIQQRDFVTLEDVTRAIDHVLDLPRAGLKDGLFNLGGRCPMSVLAIAERVSTRYAAMTGRTLPVKRRDPGPAEKAQSFDYRIDKLESTGFRLGGSLDMEIDRTLELCGAPHPSGSPNT